MPRIASTKVRVLQATTGITLVVSWLAAVVRARSSHRVVVDELVHVPQIRTFMAGRLEIHPDLTTIPGYHLLIASVMNFLSLSSLEDMRTINAFVSLGAFAAFFLVKRTLGDSHAFRSAALFFFLPILYPYYFLVYTDVLSVALILFAFLIALKGRHITAALFILASMVVRQNNVVWAVFLPVYHLWPTLRDASLRIKLCARELVKVAWPYFLPVVIFLGYWAWHGTISLSRVASVEHPDLSLHVGNVYLALFAFFLLFPFDVWSGLAKFVLAVRRNKWIALFPLLVVACDEVQGSPANYMYTHFFLHNAVLEAIQNSRLAWLAFSVMAAIAACGIAFTRFVSSQGWLLYPFAAFYLCSSWLIEWRYAIVPFAIWMALRAESPNRHDGFTLVVWFFVAQFLVWGIFTGRFML